MCSSNGLVAFQTMTQFFFNSIVLSPMNKLFQFFLLFIALSYSAAAYQNGISGRTTSGCGGAGCHSGTSSNTTLSISGNTTLTPGQQTTLTLTIQNSSRPRSGCDIDFVNSGGTAISGLATISGQGMTGSTELTHSTPKTMSGQQSTWQFNLTAPSTPGQYTVRVAGNATLSSSQGDYNTTTQSIIVKGLTLNAPTGGQTYCGGSVIGLQWTSFGVSNINIQLSTDGGSNYGTVTSTSSSNGSNSFNYTLPANTPTGTTYRLRIVDAADASLLSAMASNFSVAAGLSITTQPSPATQTVCQSANVSYTVAATGGGLTFQWRKDGTNLNGATANQLTLNNVSPTNAGSYDCVVSSSCGAPVTSNAVTLNVDPAASITTQPQAQTLCEAANATFTVAATGNGLTYKWQKNGTAITGATNATYTITGITLADAASYNCVVTGACGAPATSQAANLVVVSNPTFTTHPTSAAKCENNSITFTAAVANGNGLSYEWVKDGVTLSANARITGVNTLSLTINPLQASDAGNYQLRANALTCQSNALSNPAILGVGTAPPIVAQPQPKVSSVGGSATFSVTAIGTGLTYQWRKGTTAIAAQTNSSYTINSVAKADEGNYNVVVTNSCGSTTSTNAALTVSDVPQPALSLSSNSLNFGSVKAGATTTANFEIGNSGTAKLDVSKLTISGTGASSFSVDGAAFSVDPASKKVITVSFQPSTVGSFSAKISVASNATGTYEVSLDGAAQARALSPALVEIKDTISVGNSRDTVLRFCNITSQPLTITAVDFSGEIGSYSFIGVPITTQLPLQLAKDSCVNVPVRFTPTAAGKMDLRVNMVTSQGNDTTLLVGYGKIVVSVDWSSNAAFSIAPNPATNVAQISLPWNDARPARVRILNLLGTVVSEQDVLANSVQLDLRNLVAGNYRILVESATERLSQSLIVVR